MKQSTRRLEVETSGKGLYEISDQVVAWVRETGLKAGLLTVFIQHTSASLTIQENADPGVIRDLNDHFARLAPEDNKLYRHTAEGPDDMPAHISAGRPSSTGIVSSVSDRAARMWAGMSSGPSAV